MTLDTNSLTTRKTMHILGSTVHYWNYHAEKRITILAIHGFRGTHHGLEFIIRELPECRFIVPDLPGFGDSTPMARRVHSAENYVKFTHQFITSLNLSEPPILLGHSFGTVICAQVAATWPRLISQLILINPITRQGATVLNRYGLHITKLQYSVGKKLPLKLGNKLLASHSVTKIMNLALTHTKDPVLKRRIYTQHRTHFAKFHHRAILHQAFQSSTSDTVSPHAPYIKQHTLLIVGAKDSIVPLKTQHDLHKLFLDAELKIIKDTGHLVHYEKPETAAQYISDFLKV